MKRIHTAILLLILLTACAVAPGRTATPLPYPSFTPTRYATPTPRLASATPAPTTAEVVRAIQVSLRARGSARYQPELDAGSTTTLEALFEPVVQNITRRPDGSILSTSTTRWEKHPAAQMRYCLGAGASCRLPDEWRPFAESASVEVRLDWLGPRAYTLQAEFRDGSGQPLPALSSARFEPGAAALVSLTIVSVLNPATPLANLPGPVLTAAAATRQAFPVSGSVTIEGGRCCAGGTAGSKITLKAEFQAKSTGGAVTEMKVQAGSGGCVKDPAQLKGSWEPFQPARSYETILALNWVGWWISVQYRDGQGNLSPVYCDDISLEGSPGK